MTRTVRKLKISARAVLPMQMLTLFTSDDRALHYVERQRIAISTVIRRLERKLEWGLRLTFDEQAARDAVEARNVSPGASTERGRRAAAAPQPTQGTAYLARK